MRADHPTHLGATTLPPTTIVIPTLGRPSLDPLLDALAAQSVPVPGPVVLVDDRRPLDQTRRLGGARQEHRPLGSAALPVLVLHSGGRGPAAARNLGWRRARTAWVSFLDDDVLPDHDWYERLLHDIASAGPEVAGTQGRLTVPLPGDRRPTDWERSTAALAGARWITADLTVRRSALRTVGGFDERFRRAYREDADLGLRLTRHGGRIVRGARHVVHPVRPSGLWASVRAQAGNADDMLMDRLHGRGWHAEAGAPRGRRAAHVVTTAAGAFALLTVRLSPLLAAVAATGWLSGTVRFAWERIAPGPKDAAEVGRMALTSLVIPPVAAFQTLRGLWRHRAARRWNGLPELVLFDRDGTLVEDVPWNGDPALVRPVEDAAEALGRVRAAGVRTGIVTNQSGVARGLVTAEDVEAVNGRVAELLGPFDVVAVCPHGPEDGCGCRKPRPGMIVEACAAADADPARTVVIGDTAADAEAARAAGATGVLVPNGATAPGESAELVADSLRAAVRRILTGVER